MYKTQRRTAQFRLDDREDIAQYDEILNNPLCSVIRDDSKTLAEKRFNDEGQVEFEETKLYRVVTWEEKILL